MRFNLKEAIINDSALRKNYILRDGYIFTSWNDQPNIFNVIVIKVPYNAVGNTQYFPNSERSLNEHICLIREEKIERALIIADNVSFVMDCPTLKMLSVCPAWSVGNNFDYSPLYDVAEIKGLNCKTVYGDKDELSCTIDYSQINGLVDLGVYGKGHLNFSSADKLEKLWVSNIRNCDNLYQITCSSELKDLTLLQCGITSLEGIERHQQLQALDISYNRLLCDISMLSRVGKSLRLLNVESCSKITDFSFLPELINLEHLILLGNNVLVDLEFLKKMPKLKTFTFSMEISSGDLSPCLKIPYVYSVKNKKWYNFKDKELPKQKPTEKFVIT